MAATDPSTQEAAVAQQVQNSPRRPDARRDDVVELEREELTPSEEHPVAFGLIALLGVGLAIGLIAALAALVGSKAVVGDGERAADDSTQQQSMYLPTPSATAKGRGPGPLISIAPREQPAGEESSDSGGAINLTAGQTAVGPMERIDLTGTYDQEGAILQVQRFADGAWGDFPVTASVSGGTFTTYVQTSSVGEVKFRVVDSDTGAESNEVVVQIG